ncbi:C4-dicarboxylate ABC transporter [Motiliproteus coralliicola]|uniref:TRAP transporter small permease protein n=1 Tax=Motiliproteus coralliicola TaxID=2283196 RepID=A0A369WRS3_9GAMM|nr:TRAP transporter small permease subunit [Motiliproteus coralliicola]RDE24828.1 C4-dicarboxylate ABC transporter [Motiliproteus coralliicola]
MQFLLNLENGINRVCDWLGKLTALLFVLMLLNVFWDVVSRYLFNEVSIGMQELEWHLHATIFLLGVPYALRTGGHVRVDLIYENLSSNKKAWVDLFGTIVFLFPFCALVVWYGYDFAKEAYELGEQSGDPGGLPHRWIIKSMIPISFSFMLLSGLGLLLTSINTLLGQHEQPYKHTEL